MKISKYFMIALSGLFMASCSEDFDDWANPQSNPQEDAIVIPGFTATAVDAINLAGAEASVATFTLSESALPEGFELKNARLSMTPADVENATPVVVAAEIDGMAATADLQSLVEQAYGKRPVNRTFKADVIVNAIKDGQAVYINAGTIAVNIIPEAPFIASAYYLIGDVVGGWTAAEMVKFNHSDLDVYEDPVFTVTFSTTGDNKYFKIIPQDCIDAGNPWAIENAPNGVVGVEIDGDDALSGHLLTTTSKGEGAKAAKIAKAGDYILKINMMDYTYEIKAVASEYYMVGNVPGWTAEAAKTALFYPQSAKVFSYTTKFEGARNLKIWGKDDLGTWANAYGCAVDGDNSVSNSLVNSNAGAIVCPEEGFYTITLDFSAMTYTWTKLDNQAPVEYNVIGIIGSGIGGWGDNDDVIMTQVTSHNWYAANVNVVDGAVKFRVDHSWTTNWGDGGNIADQYYGKGVSGGSDISIQTGVYDVYFNDITGEYAFVKH